MNRRAETRTFAKFSLIGAGFAALVVLLNGLAIDVAHINASIATASVLSMLFILKYGCYRWLGIVVPSFWRYVAGNSFVTLLSTIVIASMVEYVDMSGATATAVVIGVSFVLRYAVLRRLGVIQVGTAE